MTFVRNLAVFLLLALPPVARAGSSLEDRLWDASRNGDAAAIRALIAEGADVNSKNAYGATALFFAARHGHLEAVRALLDAGADPSTGDTFYQATPLAWAVTNDHVEVALALIEAGAGELGMVLRRAAADGELVLVDAVIRTGKAGAADLTAALDAAREAGHQEVVDALQRAGAAEMVDLAEVDAETLDRYVGTYEVVPGFEIVVRRQGKQLLAQLTGQAEYKIYAKSPTEFFYTVVEATIEFVMNEAGECDELIIHQHGRNFPSRRMKSETATQPVEPAAITPEALEAFAGAYQAESGDRFNVEVIEGKLTVGPPGRKPFSLAPIEPNKFQIAMAPSVVLTFVRQGGRVVGYSVVQGGETMFRHRVDAEAPGKAEPADVPEGNWPSFRGPNASGIADGQEPPTSWNVEKNSRVVWKTPIPGLGHTSPVIWGDRVFVITAVSSDKAAPFETGLNGDFESITETAVYQWKVYCLDRATGEIRWEKTAREGVPRLSRHPKSSHANCTPATDGERLVVSFASEGLFCYDLEGNERWTVDPGLLSAGWFYDDGVQWGFASSPIIYKNLVITQCDRSRDSYIAAYDVKTGEPVWRTERDEISSWATPTVYEGEGRAELLTQAPRAIRGYDPATGAELWRLTGNSEVTVATPVVGEGLFFFTASYPPVRPIYAVRPGANGDITLKAGETANESIAWSDPKGGTYLPTPLVYRGLVYTLSNNGVVTCLDAKTGELRHRVRLGDGSAGGFTASPVAADGRLYFTAEDGDVYVVTATDTPVVVAVNPLGEACLSTPAISGRTIFFRTQGHVVAVGGGTR